MVAHRTLTPFVRVRILHPLPKLGTNLVPSFLYNENPTLGVGFKST